jgi:uncharacterized surface protein with fasciclin (FAS1) repeats
LIIIIGYGCNGDIPDDSYVTFTGDMVYSYLKKKPETYSEFVKVINKSGLKGMLSAYGTYSCLAPTNTAMNLYYKSLGANFTFDSLTTEQINYIAKTHIIPDTYLTIDLVTGAIPTPNMNQRYILINFTTDSVGKLQIILNSESKIISKDIEVYNGAIHTLDRVLQPSNAQLPDLIVSNSNLSIFASALVLTGLSDSLRLIEDKSYVPVNTFPDISGSGHVPSPEYRKFGYTVLAESNDVFAANGITSLNDLKAKAAEWYPSGSAYANDFTNRNNSIKQYISYHLINKTINYNSFIYKSNSVPNVTRYEFIESMYPNALMKVNDDLTGLKINQDVERGANGVTILSQDAASKDQSAINGVYHLIDNVLLYTDATQTMLLNTRIRFDISSLLPELATNGIRGLAGKDFCFPQGYLANLKFSKESRLYYLGSRLNWENYQGDEMMGLGSYDLTLRLPPVPPGTYELRYGYNANQFRGVAQIYVDNQPIGIPLDLRIWADNPKIGWLEDALTTDNGVENDKMMRNRGYLKGPITFQSQNGDVKMIARNHKGALRRVIGTFTFETSEPHYIRFKSVLEDRSAQFHMDYIEYVPKNIYGGATAEDRN